MYHYNAIPSRSDLASNLEPERNQVPQEHGPTIDVQNNHSFGGLRIGFSLMFAPCLDPVGELNF